MSVQGVALNDWPHPVTANLGGKQVWKCPLYQCWTNTLIRCKTPIGYEREPTYRDVDICEDWLSFSNFRFWAESRWQEGLQLDKDLLVTGSKLYSPETCCFISPELNKTLHIKSQGVLPTGVSKDKELFSARVNNGDAREYLGSASTPMLAHHLWQRRKSEILCEFALNEPDAQIAKAIWKIVDKIRADMYNGVETKSFKEA